MSTALEPTMLTRSSSGVTFEKIPGLSNPPEISPLFGPGVLLPFVFVLEGRSFSPFGISFASSDTISCIRSSTRPAEFCATHEYVPLSDGWAS